MNCCLMPCTVSMRIQFTESGGVKARNVGGVTHTKQTVDGQGEDPRSQYGTSQILGERGK